LELIKELLDDVYQILVCKKAKCTMDIRMFKYMKTLHKNELPDLYRSSIGWNMRMQWVRYVARIGRRGIVKKCGDINLRKRPP